MGGGGGAAVERGLDYREDGALDRRGDQDLGPAAVGVGRRRGFFLVRRDLPDPLEDRAGEDAAKHADAHADRLIEQLSHELRLPGRSPLTPSPETTPGSDRCGRTKRGNNGGLFFLECS